MNSFRRLLVVAALALVAPALVACGSEKKSGDDAGASTFGVLLHEDGFRVRLPKKATPRTQTVQTAAGPLTVTLYLTTVTGGANYLVAMTEVPAGGTVDLDGAVNGAASNVGGTVQTSDHVTYLGHEGRDAKITATSGGQAVTVFSRFLHVDDKLFQLQYISPEADLAAPPSEYHKVLDSVRFD